MKNGLNFQILTIIYSKTNKIKFHYIYFIENDIKYYMYLLVKKIGHIIMLYLEKIPQDIKNHL